METIASRQCAIENSSDYYLLPGTTGIFLNNSYASETDVSEILTGDTSNSTLRMDITSISVSYEITESSALPSSFVEHYRQ